MQGKEFTTDMRLLDLGVCDMVLVIQWLTELGPILWDFKNLWMEFKADGKRCVLRGSPAGPNKTLSTTQMGKTLKSTVQASSAHICSIQISEQGEREESIQNEEKPLPPDLKELLQHFDEVFAVPVELPPQRKQDYRIPLKPVKEWMKQLQQEWQTDTKIQKLIQDIQEDPASHSKFTWFNNQLSRLGHSLRECPEYSDGKEAITEAQLRLNVWLRSESPPKRFNNRYTPAGRRSWENQSGKPHFGAGQGIRRMGAFWNHSEEGGSVKNSGNRNWRKDSNSQLIRQVGGSSNIEPINISTGKCPAIKEASGKSLTGEGLDDGRDAAAEKLPLANRVCINEGERKKNSPAKDTQSMEVDRPAGRVIEERASDGPVQNIRPKEPDILLSERAPIADHPKGPYKSSSAQIIEGPNGKPTQTGVKWKRAARDIKRNQLSSDLGKITSLGKRDTTEREKLSLSTVKKAKISDPIGDVAASSGEVQVKILQENSILQVDEALLKGDGNVQAAAQRGKAFSKWGNRVDSSSSSSDSEDGFWGWEGEGNFKGECFKVGPLGSLYSPGPIQKQLDNGPVREVIENGLMSASSPKLVPRPKLVSDGVTGM
ncbi:hypothetical protein LWI29_000814 [Acer saccharum]|uniref:SOCS box domain-containing protein n=1 Tax=Acer saccharum TaxID=4024 RepID=A0AA39TC97_ACESA|nr:hypothetical protein LWI29_000814 [Acer saccharum]